jgi:outer membrane protein assembly factor BamB
MSKRLVLRISVAALAIVAGAVVTLYLTNVIGCSPPKTSIAQRKLYEGPATNLSAVEDWPRWRGPRIDQISREAAPEALPAGGAKLLWSADVGLGYSSPIAARGRVYLFTMNELKDTLTCFDAVTGKIVWSVEGAEGWHASYHGTRSTPAIDADRIYTYGGQADLTARRISDGKEQWRVNILAETNGMNLSWGVASSPLILGNMVYVQGGKGGSVVVAVDKNSGSVVWKSQATGLGGYAAPVLADVGGTQQLIVLGGDAVWGMNPQDGKTIWSHPWQTSYDVNSSTPIYDVGTSRLLITSAYDHGSLQLQLSPTGATKTWENRNIESRFQGAILENGFLYANSEGTITCVNWLDGSVKWKAKDPDLRLGIGGSMIRAGDKLIVMSERGKLGLARATPEGIKLLGQAKDLVEGREVWSTPLLYGGRLYVKGGQEFSCFDLSK